MIHYSIWHIWMKPILNRCFPTRCLGKQCSTEESQQRADISVNLKSQILWPRKYRCSKFKNRCLQVRENILSSGEHITSTNLYRSRRGNILGICPAYLKRLVVNLIFITHRFKKSKCVTYSIFNIQEKFVFKRKLSAHVLLFKGLRKCLSWGWRGGTSIRTFALLALP